MNASRITVTAFVSAATCLLFGASPSRAADLPEGISIAYRLPAWKTMHFDDPVQAQQHLAAVQQLGCVARSENHGGHIDVTYRTAGWRHVTVASDQLAHRWEGWLKGAGFETLHGHAEDPLGGEHRHDHAGHDHAHGAAEMVAYRLTRWTTQRFSDTTEAGQFVSVAKGFGCEVREEGRDGSLDVSVRCLVPHHAEFVSHDAAQAWEQWLRKFGFETRHAH